MYSRRFPSLQAIAYQAFTFFETRARPSSGEWASPFVSSRRRMFVMNPVEMNATLLSGADASAFLYTSQASGASLELRCFTQSAYSSARRAYFWCPGRAGFPSGVPTTPISLEHPTDMSPRP